MQLSLYIVDSCWQVVVSRALRCFYYFFVYLLDWCRRNCA